MYTIFTCYYSIYNVRALMLLLRLRKWTFYRHSPKGQSYWFCRYRGDGFPNGSSLQWPILSSCFSGLPHSLQIVNVFSLPFVRPLLYAFLVSDHCNQFIEKNTASGVNRQNESCTAHVAHLWTFQESKWEQIIHYINE